MGAGAIASRWLTVNGKGVPCGQSFATRKTWVTDALPVAKLDAKDLSKFWTAETKAISTTAWKPVSDDLQGVDAKAWAAKAQDQFSRTLELQHAKGTAPEAWESSRRIVVKQLEPEVVVKTAKIRFHPTASQARLLRKCLGAHRYFWNKSKAWVESKYNEAKLERVAWLEAGVSLGCAHCTPAKACTKGADCELHHGVQGCHAEVKVTKSGKVMKVPKCMAIVKSAGGRCGDPVADPDAEVGYSDKYFCDEHVGAGLGVCASHEGHSIYSPITIRDAVLTKDSDLPEDDWQREIPYDTRQGAIRAFTDAMSSFFEVRKGNPKAEPPGFLSKRKRDNKVFTCLKDAFSIKDGTLRLFPRRMKEALRVAHKDKKRLIKHCSNGDACDGTVLRTVTGKWYIVLPRKIVQEKVPPMGGDVYLDPGGRTFNTFYSPDGLVGKIGDNLYKDPTVTKALLKSDKLMSKAATMANECMGKSRKRTNVLNRAQALRTKVRDIVRDVHCKTWSFLCSNFKRVFVPEFKAPEMTKVGDRVINSKAVRGLMTFAHSEFRNGLIEYGRRRGVDVYVVSEAHTTKTCGGCGASMDVGSNKVVNCAACGLRMDRDHSGARNIFLKCATELKATW
jgi:transposase